MAKRESFLKRLFGFLWRTVALLYAIVSLLLLILVPVFVYFSLQGASKVEVEDNMALVWAPVGDLVEQRESNVGSEVVEQLLAAPSRSTVVRDLIRSLEAAAQDSRITLAFLKLDEMGAASPGQLQDLANAIDTFKASGKKVVAWSPTYGQAQYYLAARADTVYLDPLGFVFLEGYGVYRNYFKEALDKLGVEINVFRVGDYKSFVEPFTRNDMSPEARAANRVWLTSLWQNYREGVTGARVLKPEDIDAYIAGYDTLLENAGGNAARVALDAGLVDELASIEEMRDDMREIVGSDEDHGSFRQVNNFDYLRVVRSEEPEPRTDSRIGLVVVDGPIVDGESGRGSAGGETVARLIADVRRDDHASALLLRVNSPGGSLYASERIRREVALTRETGKPVVVSMSGLGASGGYWISMNANQIWAEPATLTGSIGVFGVVPTFSEPLKKIGIHTDGVGTTPLSGALKLDRPLDPKVKQIFQTGIEYAYGEFVAKVAEARGMSVAAVERIAQGRVWSGADANRLGLVDELGGFNQALAATAKLAGLQPGDYELKEMRPLPDWRSALLEFFSLNVSQQWLPDWLAQATADPGFKWLRHGLNDPRGQYAHCFCEPVPAMGLR